MLFLIFACNPWDIDPETTDSLDKSLWDPNLIAVEGGAYVNLPYAGQLAWVESNGSSSLVDLNRATPERLVSVPDGLSLIVLSGWDTCEDDDPKIKYLSDCPISDQGHQQEFELVRSGKVINILDIPPEFQAFAFSKDGSIAAASLDLASSSTLTINGMLNLTAVVFVEIGTGVTHEVSIGFAAEAVVFSEDGAKAVVLSRSQVAVVDLNTWQRTVTFPLTLDPDQVVSPKDVILAEDSRYALVTVAGSADLYVLDLEQESIDLVELGVSPDDMAEDLGSNQTVIVSDNSRSVQVLEHEFFETTSFPLDEGTNRILDTENWTILYSVNSYNHDVYLFDPANGILVEYRAENPVMEMQLSPDGLMGVATLMPDQGVGQGVGGFYDQNYGLGLFPLAEDADPIALVLEGPPVGVELVEKDGFGKALVLMSGVDTLLSVDLASAVAQPIELDVVPTGIHAMPEGLYAITQASELGQISFFDPATEKITVASGFATQGLFVDNTLPRRETNE
jgi:hypothetical protein